MRRALILGFLLALAASAWTLWPNTSAAVTPGRAAPEIAGDNWINSQPLSIAGLKGRVVLWNFGPTVV